MEVSLEWTQDKLYLEQTSAPTKTTTPLRQVLSLALASYIDLSDHWLLHPQIRGEFTSDLPEEYLSIHPGVGSRYKIKEHLDILANFSFISRAPNFNEVYRRIAGLSLDNPNLRRQKSLQADLGYEFRGRAAESISLEFQQAIFVDRTAELLQSINISASDAAPLYQVQNIGTSLGYGVESQLRLKWSQYLQLDSDYTVQQSRVSDKSRDYQPTQRLNLNPKFFPEDWVNLTLPLYVRSSVKAGNFILGPQWDLGLKIDLQIKKTNLRLEFFNLLGWNREELQDFPLSNEPSVKLSSNFTF